MGMKLLKTDLLPGEERIDTKFSNAVITLSEHGLSKFVADDYLWAVGMKGKEAIGGMLHLTNYRLVFKAHAINRLKGKLSIFLPVISTLEDASYFWTRKVKVTTELTESEFVMWGIPQFINTFEEAQATLADEVVADIQAEALRNYDKCGDGLSVFGGIEAINKAFLLGRGGEDLVAFATNPLEVIGATILDEFLGTTVKESWNEKFIKKGGDVALCGPATIS